VGFGAGRPVDEGAHLGLPCSGRAAQSRDCCHTERGAQLRRGCAAVRRIGDDALRRRMPTVIDLDGAWLGGNACVRVMNLAVRK
jgi:hypothetical protein